PETKPAAQPTTQPRPDNGRGAPQPRSSPTPSTSPTIPVPRPSVQSARPAPASVAAAGAIQVIDATATRPRVLAPPATRRLAGQLGVEIGQVTPTGKPGRVTTEDVRRYRPDGGGAATQAPVARHAPIAIARGGEEERIPLRGLRKRIAE